MPFTHNAILVSYLPRRVVRCKLTAAGLEDAWRQGRDWADTALPPAEHDGRFLCVGVGADRENWEWLNAAADRARMDQPPGRGPVCCSAPSAAASANPPVS